MQSKKTKTLIMLSDKDKERIGREAEKRFDGCQIIEHQEAVGICKEAMQSESIYQQERAKKLVEALEEAKTIIRQWHGTAMSQEEESKMWEIYERNAPEMKRINSALNEYNNQNKKS